MSENIKLGDLYDIGFYSPIPYTGNLVEYKQEKRRKEDRIKQGLPYIDNSDTLMNFMESRGARAEYDAYEAYNDFQGMSKALGDTDSSLVPLSQEHRQSKLKDLDSKRAAVEAYLSECDRSGEEPFRNVRAYVDRNYDAQKREMSDYYDTVFCGDYMKIPDEYRTRIEESYSGQWGDELVDEARYRALIQGYALDVLGMSEQDVENGGAFVNTIADDLRKQGIKIRDIYPSKDIYNYISQARIQKNADDDAAVAGGRTVYEAAARGEDVGAVKAELMKSMGEEKYKTYAQGVRWAAARGRADRKSVERLLPVIRPALDAIARNADEFLTTSVGVPFLSKGERGKNAAIISKAASAIRGMTDGQKEILYTVLEKESPNEDNYAVNLWKAFNRGMDAIDNALVSSAHWAGTGALSASEPVAGMVSSDASARMQNAVDENKEFIGDLAELRKFALGRQRPTRKDKYGWLGNGMLAFAESLPQTALGFVGGPGSFLMGATFVGDSLTNAYNADRNASVGQIIVSGLASGVVQYKIEMGALNAAKALLGIKQGSVLAAKFAEKMNLSQQAMRLNSGLARGAARAGVTTGLIAGGEMIEEKSQQLSDPVVQSVVGMMSDYNPDIDWSAFWKDYLDKDANAELIVSCMAFGLIGGGARFKAESSFHKTLMNQHKVLKDFFGFDDATLADIRKTTDDQERADKIADGVRTFVESNYGKYRDGILVRASNAGQLIEKANRAGISGIEMYNAVRKYAEDHNIGIEDVSVVSEKDFESASKFLNDPVDINVTLDSGSMSRENKSIVYLGVAKDAVNQGEFVGNEETRSRTGKGGNVTTEGLYGDGDITGALGSQSASTNVGRQGGDDSITMRNVRRALVAQANRTLADFGLAPIRIEANDFTGEDQYAVTMEDGSIEYFDELDDAYDAMWSEMEAIEDEEIEKTKYQAVRWKEDGYVGSLQDQATDKMMDHLDDTGMLTEGQEFDESGRNTRMTAEKLAAKNEKLAKALQARIQIYAQQEGLEQGYTGENLQVFGRNFSTMMKDGTYRFTQQIFAGANPLDAFEERVEGITQWMIENAEYTEDQFETALRQLEDATGDKYLSESDDRRQAIVEGVSRAARANLVGQIKDENLPDLLRKWFRRMVLWFGNMMEFVNEVKRARNIMKPEARQKVDAKFMKLLQDFAGLDENARIERARREEEKQIAAEAMGGIDEIGEWAEGKLPRPNDARKAGDDLAGELQRIYDAKTRIIRRQAKRKDGTAGKTYEQRNVLEAERFFSKDGSLSHVFEQALEAGFEFDNSGEMLSAIYDSLVYGRRTYATRGMSEGSMYSMSVGERSAPWKQEIIRQTESTESGRKLIDIVERVRTRKSGYKPTQRHTPVEKVNSRTIESVRKESGRDVSGYYHAISEDNIWHAYLKHSLDSILEDNQISLEWDDFKILPDILNNWDSLEYRMQGNIPTLLYKKKYGNVEYMVSQRIGTQHRNRENVLMFTTEWIKKEVAEASGISPNHLKSTPHGLRTDMTYQKREEFKRIYGNAIKNGDFLNAPNGERSNLTPFQWLAVRTQAFKNWFGDWESNPDDASKVVDENGEPLAVYHGTWESFTRFKRGMLGGGDDSAPARSFVGHWFSVEKLKGAKEYMPVFLNIRSPHEVSFLESLDSEISDGNYSTAISTRKKLGSGFAKKMRENGEDGVIVEHDREIGGMSYVVLDSNQVKSATDNRGTFDGANPDITFSLGNRSGGSVWEYLADAVTRGPKEEIRVMEAIQRRLAATLEANGFTRDGRYKSGEGSLDLDKVKAIMAVLDSVTVGLPRDARAGLNQSYISDLRTKSLEYKSNKGRMNAVKRLVKYTQDVLDRTLAKKKFEQLERLIEWATAKSGENRILKGKMTSDYQNKFLEIENAMEAKGEQLERMRNLLAESVELALNDSPAAAEEAREKMLIWDIFGGLYQENDNGRLEADALQVDTALQAAQELYTKGRLARAELDAARKERISSLLEMAMSAIGAEGAVNTVDRTGAVRVDKGELRTALGGYESFEDLILATFGDGEFSRNICDGIRKNRLSLNDMRFGRQKGFYEYFGEKWGAIDNKKGAQVGEYWGGLKKGDRLRFPVRRRVDSILKDLNQPRDWGIDIKDPLERLSERLTMSEARAIMEERSVEPEWMKDNDARSAFREQYRSQQNRYDDGRMSLDIFEGGRHSVQSMTWGEARAYLDGTSELKPSWLKDKETMDGLRERIRRRDERTGKWRLEVHWEKDSGKTRRLDTLSEMEAVKLLLDSRQERYMDNLRLEGYDEAVLEHIDAQLSQRGHEVMEWLIGQYEKEYDEINPVYKRMYGVDMPREAFYAPGLFESSGDLTMKDPTEGTGSGGRSIGSIKRRVKHYERPAIVSALTVYWSHTQEIDHWVSFAESLLDLKVVLRNKTLRGNIDKIFGATRSRIIDKWIEFLEFDGVRSSNEIVAISKFANRVLGARALGALSFNFKTCLRQFPAAFASAAETTPAEALKGIGTCLFNPGDLKEIWNSKTIQQRISLGMSPEMRSAMTAAQIKPGMLADAVQWGMVPISIADAAFTTLSAYTAYRAELDRCRKEGGLTEEEMKQNALAVMDRTVRRTAQPVETEQKSPVEITGGWAFRHLMLFKSDMRKQVGLTIRALQMAKRGDIGWGKASWRVFNSWFMYGIFNQIATDALLWAIGSGGFSDDDDDPWWERYLYSGALGAFSGVLGAAELFMGIYEVLFGREAETFDNSSISSIRKLKRSYEKILSDEEMEWDDVAKVINSIGRSINNTGVLAVAGLHHVSAAMQTVGRVVNDSTNMYNEWSPVWDEEAASEKKQKEVIDKVKKETKDEREKSEERKKNALKNVRDMDDYNSRMNYYREAMMTKEEILSVERKLASESASDTVVSLSRMNRQDRAKAMKELERVLSPEEYRKIQDELQKRRMR